MKLLNTCSFTLTEFFTQARPKYVILSHAWGDGELLYGDIMNGTGKSKKGYTKLEGCCRKAIQDGFEWVWIDTCCINKDSSAELTEAINSMFIWYKEAIVCYAYLADITSAEAPKFTASRYFTRGWTLQELIAPPIVEFYSREWIDIGMKSSLHKQILHITGIPQDVLLGSDPLLCNIAERMSWARKRKTTRSEDMAYCLLGIFDINMPMLYGEGSKAFLRLQREILLHKADYSIFAWSNPFIPRQGRKMSNLAFSPFEFAKSHSDFTQRKYESDCRQLAATLPDGFSTIQIKDYRRLAPVSPEVFIHFDTINRTVPYPPIMTSRGLRLTVLVSQPYLNVRYVFLNLEYDGGYVCIKEVDSSRHAMNCIFTCKKNKLLDMKYHTLYFDTDRAGPFPADILHPPTHDKRYVELCYQHAYGNHSLTLMSLYNLHHYENVLGRYRFSYSQRYQLCGVLILHINQHQVTLASEVLQPTPEDRAMAVAVGQEHVPWCAIHQKPKSFENISDLWDFYVKSPTPSPAIDRDACFIDSETVISVTFRKMLGICEGEDVTHRLSIAIHEVGKLPYWVSLRVQDQSRQSICE